jgi:nickel-dependent lactate racemase
LTIKKYYDIIKFMNKKETQISYALGTASEAHRDTPVGVGMHSENLYDQNEDGAGHRLDPATGEPYDNSTYNGMEHLTIQDHSIASGNGWDVLHDGEDREQEQAIEKWLRERDAAARIARTSLSKQ